MCLMYPTLQELRGVPRARMTVPHSGGSAPVHLRSFNDPSAAMFTISALILIAFIYLWCRRPMNPSTGVPMLSDTLPYVSNTYRYMTDPHSFLLRVTYVARSRTGHPALHFIF